MASPLIGLTLSAMTLVVATDFSPGSGQVALVGAHLAARLGVALRLVHVSTDPRASAVLHTEAEHLLDPARRQLEAEAQRLRDAAGVTVEPLLCAGPVADALADAAERVAASMLLVAPSPRAWGSLRRRIVERLARQLRVPLLVIQVPEGFDAWLHAGRPLRVIVGSDLGPSSAAAMQFVAALAPIGPVEATLVSVAVPTEVTVRLGLPPPVEPRILPPEAREALERALLAQAEAAGLPSARVRVVPGEAAPEAYLAVLAAEEQAHLVVVGSRRRGWIESIWQGSVARGLLRTAATNVAAVSREGVADKPVVAPRLATVVVGTDLSALGDGPIPYAYTLVAEGGAVHLAYVLDAGPLAPQSRPFSDPTLQRHLLERVPHEAVGRSVRTEVHVLLGDPAEALVSLALRVGADALCLGSHGRSGLGAAVMGSVTQSVIAHAHCPVLVVPRPRE